MERNSPKYQLYVQVLQEELRPAMGCTEPIALAYAAALARDQMAELPQKVDIEVSGNIIKNVKSVIVPHTGGLKGIPAAVAAGIIVAKPERQLEVLSEVTPEQIREIGQYLEQAKFHVEQMDTTNPFDIRITLRAGDEWAQVRIVGDHTNLIYLSHNGIAVYDHPCEGVPSSSKTDRSTMNVEDILEFADSVILEDVQDVLDRQMAYNWAIAEEGMRGSYGASIGKVLKDSYGDSTPNKAKYMAAAGSDARMNGCELPVIINSGSGNQGITASVPVMVYAKDNGTTKENLYRALVVSNLCTTHLKTGIGTLSAYCGAVSAGCGAAAGIAYLNGGGVREVAHTLVNAMAIGSGIICDGAKASCAAKIAVAVDAGLLGYQMCKNGMQFYAGDGIVKKGIENTIKTVGSLAHDGMVDTDREIIHLMMTD